MRRLIFEEPINIISTSYNCKKINGPGKVLNNTLMGLDRIGQKYVINKPLENYRYNWIHDSQRHFLFALINEIPVLLGPNLFVLPKDMPPIPSSDTSIYLHPSDWCVNVWKALGFNKISLKYWPAGIDWESFYKPPAKKDSKKVMVYYKERIPLLLDKVLMILEKKGFIPILVRYKFYNEDEYKNVINNCSFGVWLGRSESQGIALEEALASDLPLIVIDAKRYTDTCYVSGGYKFPTVLNNFQTTSAPYFDDQCGIIIDNINKLDSAISKLNSKLSDFHPLKYIQNNLSLEKQAYQLIELLAEIDNNRKPVWIKKDKKISLFPYLSFEIIYSWYLFKRKSKTLTRIILRNN